MAKGIRLSEKFRIPRTVFNEIKAQRSNGKDEQNDPIILCKYLVGGSLSKKP